MTTINFAHLISYTLIMLGVGLLLVRTWAVVMAIAQVE